MEGKNVVKYSGGYTIWKKFLITNQFLNLKFDKNRKWARDKISG